MKVSSLSGQRRRELMLLARETLNLGSRFHEAVCELASVQRRAGWNAAIELVELRAKAMHRQACAGEDVWEDGFALTDADVLRAELMVSEILGPEALGQMFVRAARRPEFARCLRSAFEHHHAYIVEELGPAAVALAIVIQAERAQALTGAEEELARLRRIIAGLETQILNGRKAEESQ